jgi:hypothetical protein
MVKLKNVAENKKKYEQCKMLYFVSLCILTSARPRVDRQIIEVKYSLKDRGAPTEYIFLLEIKQG